MLLDNIGGIALGGVVAAVVAFWSQAKSLFMQVVSILVVQVDTVGSLSNAINTNLRLNYKQPPTGLLSYYSQWVAFKSKEEHLVPFRSLTSTNIFYGHRRILLLSIKSNGSRIVSIRGLCNLNDLVKESCLFMEHRTAAYQQGVQRFAIYNVIGREKGMWAGSSRIEATAESASAPPTTDSTGSPDLFNDIHIDTPLFHKREDFFTYQKIDPLEGLFYDKEVLKHLEDAKRWMRSQAWYQQRSIPWKRGWLIHGPGGTGKSSLAQVVAKTLNIPLYSFMLSTLSDQEFITHMQQLGVPCVVLFEDFDTVFRGREPITEHKSLTFDCVLNQISGVKTLNGVFLIVTTNHVENIDEALGVTSSYGAISTRPGRVDQVIYLGVTSTEVRYKMVRHILLDWPEAHDRLVKEGEGMTAVQFQETCIQFAFSHINGKENHGA